MARIPVIIILFLYSAYNATAQDIVSRANKFINTLDDTQKVKVLYPFDTAERYRFMYIPLDDRHE